MRILYARITRPRFFFKLFLGLNGYFYYRIGSDLYFALIADRSKWAVIG